MVREDVANELTLALDALEADCPDSAIYDTVAALERLWEDEVVLSRLSESERKHGKDAIDTLKALAHSIFVRSLIEC